MLRIRDYEPLWQRSEWKTYQKICGIIDFIDTAIFSLLGNPFFSISLLSFLQLLLVRLLGMTVLTCLAGYPDSLLTNMAFLLSRHVQYLDKINKKEYYNTARCVCRNTMLTTVIVTFQILNAVPIFRIIFACHTMIIH